MTQIITGSSLVQQPHDKFWDGNPTRREIQKALNKIAANEAEMMGMCDTAALILNYICEVQLKVKREDIEVYVEAKKLQLEEMRKKMKADAAANEAANGPNG